MAVVLDAEDLTATQMQTIAQWTNLSETTFVTAPTDPGADYHVRIFTPVQELPFAGHPTLGTARAWLDAGNAPRTPGTVIQQCGVGLVPVRVDGDRLSFAAPPRVRSGTPADADLDRACERLRLTREEVVATAWVDNGPGWLGIVLANADRVLAIDPDPSPTDEAGHYGVVGPYGAGGPDGVAVEVRAFIYDPGTAVREDPVTGSLNAALGQWLTESGRLTAPYVARQGTAMGRDGRVSVTAEGSDLWIGGSAHILLSGSINVADLARPY
ncbi:PhzF family phenazine biosynthesis protein [Demequina globuliformis]|uniref:PhzF family phenazine biosynthesis protein n=1 Tax=Demequina globuliformis TaxID=676202 RepID=UPI000A7A00F3